METTELNGFEIEHLNSSGNVIHYESRVSPIKSNEEVEGLVVSSRDISQRKEMERKLEHLSLHDPLTGLPNKRFLESRINELGKLVVRQKLRLEIAIIDLDNFKKINDSYGHAVGDLVLAEIGNRIKENTRESDFAARYGGDEFIVLFVDHVNATEEKFHERFGSIFKKPVNVDDIEIRVTASIGYSSYNGGELDSGAIIKQADDSMYRVKSQKRKASL